MLAKWARASTLEKSRPRKSAPLKKRNAGQRGSRVERKWQRRDGIK